MKRKHCKIASILLTLAVLTATVMPVSAHGSGGGTRRCSWWYPSSRCSWSCCTRPTQPSQSCQPSEPSQPETPSIPSQPGTPSQPTTPTTPTIPITPVTPDTGSVSSLEKQVVELVNQERAVYGLPALTLSATLSDGARLKSRDMQQSRYFDHNSPNYGTPFEMMKSLGITYAAAGENIAMGYSTAEAVVSAWMNSPGHRANILSENYTHIGVGYVASGGYWTQWFTR